MTPCLAAVLVLVFVAAADGDGGPVIGIDLGTTYSCVGLYRNKRVEIIANDQGNRITPSWVAFTGGGERLVGEAAKNQGIVNANNTVFDVKRLMGRQFSDADVQRDRHLWPFQLAARANGGVVIQIGGGGAEYTPEEISAMILRKMRETAEAYYGGPITRAVVTVPAYATDAQRQATKDAAAIAGLTVLRILNEPTAAALAYGFESATADAGGGGATAVDGERVVMVVDLGGGTHDVTLLTIDHDLIEVMATSGDPHLGGEDFDARVMAHIIDRLVAMVGPAAGADPWTDKRFLQKVRREAERAKKVLSAQTQVEVVVDVGGDQRMMLSRATFERLNEDLFARVLEPVRRVLADVKLEAKDVDEVLLVGGSTRIPRVQQLLTAFFGGRLVLNKSLNPDEAIAMGAAIQGHLLGGDDDDDDRHVLTLLDVTPLSLGIRTRGDVMTVMIPRNSRVPTAHTRVFTTAAHGQTAVDIQVFEGERARAADNHALGNVSLTGLPPGLPAGQVQIEVTFELDANSVLTVSGRLLHSDDGAVAARLEIRTEKGRLTQAEIDALLDEANAHAAEDARYRQLYAELERIAGELGDDDLLLSGTDAQRRPSLADLEQRLARARRLLQKKDL